MSDKVTKIILEFPEGLDTDLGNRICEKVQYLSGYNVSSGGFLMLSNPFLVDESNPMRFDEDTLHYVYPYKRGDKKI